METQDLLEEMLNELRELRADLPYLIRELRRPWRESPNEGLGPVQPFRKKAE